MLAVLEILRIRFAGRPLLLSIAVLALLLIVRRTGDPAVNSAWMRRASRVAAVAGLLALMVYPIVAIWYAASPHFFDNAEPTMPAVGWLFHVGQPVYHSVDAGSRYAHIYGPLTFIVQGTVLGAFGPFIEVSKAVGATAGIVSLALVFATVRRHLDVTRSAVLTGLCASLLLLFRNYSFWTRPDPLQLLAASAALLCAVRGRGYGSAAMVGLASGLLWNLKFTGPLYSLPVLVLVHSRTAWRGTALAIGVGAAVSVAPFVLFSNVSLVNYVTWIRLSAGTGLLLSLLRQNLEWALFLGLPLLLSFHAVDKDLRRYDTVRRNMMAALLVAGVGVVIAAAKPGAGPYHLLPFIPVIAFLVAWQIADAPALSSRDPVAGRAVIAFVVVVMSLCLAQQAQFITAIRAQQGLRDGPDVERFASTHDGVVQMGYGQTEALSFARPILVFRTDTYLLDQPAIRENQLAGLELPPATIEAITACRVKYWLIPKGERPFSGVNGYAAVFLRPLYPPEFRRAFEATHKQVGVTTYFDVWECQGKGGT
jgi:hypothetical protein